HASRSTERGSASEAPARLSTASDWLTATSNVVEKETAGAAARHTSGDVVEVDVGHLGRFHLRNEVHDARFLSHKKFSTAVFARFPKREPVPGGSRHAQDRSTSKRRRPVARRRCGGCSGISLHECETAVTEFTNSFTLIAATLHLQALPRGFQDGHSPTKTPGGGTTVTTVQVLLDLSVNGVQVCGFSADGSDGSAEVHVAAQEVGLVHVRRLPDRVDDMAATEA
ncbi:hypothetical protein ABT063_37950, partial [Streptomyces sp. NPDC002838]|uniref:hypothetical protein n=1 Tax=Streptomyces sp. NPDC002838 TaxID=3154436 RepID=UPI0033261B97